MAFQQPVARPARRSAAPPPIETNAVATTRNPDLAPVSDSQEWVLFSPDLRKGDAASASDSLQTPRTAAKSRLDSDLGSLDTRALSEQDSRQAPESAVEDDDADDLDSLDDGLHAFEEPTSSTRQAVDLATLDASANAILPTHDGLGGFPGSSSPVQEQFWRHERTNPRRRRSSTRRSTPLQNQVDVPDQHEEHHPTLKDERFQRIEKWRMDQSRAIMEEIERESRRLRRRNRLSTSSSRPPAAPVEESPPTAVPAPEPISAFVETSSQPESFWTRLTRSVMRDLMGFDVATLTYIFGEEAANIARQSREEEMMREAERVAREEAERAEQAEAASWEERLLARIARELGSFVHEVSEHPGAFSSFLKAQDDVPYAGLPTPPELMSEGQQRRHQARHLARHRRRQSAAKTDPLLFGIEEEVEADGNDENDLTPQVSRQQEAYEASLRREKEYWERDLDVKMVFGYLRDRLSGSPPSTSTDASSMFPPPQTVSSSVATASTNPSDSLRRAALIRHHHPLVSKKYASSESVALPMPLSPILGRRPSSVVDDDGASSCASQSTKKSKTRHSESISLGSSRNYWDIGSPSWGEV